MQDPPTPRLRKLSSSSPSSAIFNIPFNRSRSNTSTTSTSSSTPSDEADEEYARLITTTNQRQYYLIFFLLGVTVVLPWNIWITANDYFITRWQHESFAVTFQNWFSVVFMLGNLGVLVWMMFIPGLINLHQRMKIGLITTTLIFGIQTLFSALPFTLFPKPIDFIITIILVIISSISTGLVQNALFALVTDFPPIYTQAILSGQGLSGTCPALMQIGLLALSVGGNENEGRGWYGRIVFVYFLMGVVVPLGAVFGIKVLSRARKRDYSEGSSQISPSSSRSGSSVFVSAEIPNTEEELEEERLETDQLLHHTTPLTTLQLIKRNFSASLSIFTVFFVTLSIFPGLVSKIAPQNSYYQQFFIPLMFLAYNITDWIGKALPGVIYIRNLKLLSILSYSRVIFIPLFLIFTNIRIRNDNPEWYQTDLAAFCLISALGVSNGFVCSNILMLAPSIGEGSEKVETKRRIGELLAVCLALGLLGGGAFGFLLVNIVS